MMAGGMGVQVSGGGGGGGKGPGQPQSARLLTNSVLDELRALPGVASVIAREYLMTGVLIKYQKMEGGVGVIGVDTSDLSSLRLEATQGDTALGRGTIVIGAMVPSNFYDPHLRPGQEPPPP